MGSHLPSCAQYSIDADSASESLLPLFQVFEQGGQIRQADEHTAILMPSSFYFVSYHFIAGPGSWKYFRILLHSPASLSFRVSYPESPKAFSITGAVSIAAYDA